MTEQHTALTVREKENPGPFTRFLWWLATAEKEILAGCITDGNRYSIIGMTVLATWLFATMAWTYFFSTVVDNLFVAILPGLFMGFIVLTIDRALIKGISKQQKNKLLPLLFRGVLALTIGFFMAQPALLYLFDKEIKMQTSLDNEKRRQQKRSELDTLYAGRKVALLKEKENIDKATEAKYDDVNKARNGFIAETDGSGGTGKVGIKDVALAKKSEYEKLDAGYQSMLTINRAKTDSIDKELGNIENNIKKDEAIFEQYLNNGFLTRVEALNNLIKSNNALQLRYYLIVFILMLIELMPVIAKSMLPNGSYDEKVTLREAMEKETARSNINREQELKELYNQMAHDNDREAITAFFSLTKKDREEKMQAFSTRWKEDKQQSFDGLWEKMKKEILTRQEQ
jgi:predicted Holliday junction resolvase-like endonuclease